MSQTSSLVECVRNKKILLCQSCLHWKWTFKIRACVWVRTFPSGATGRKKPYTSCPRYVFYRLFLSRCYFHFHSSVYSSLSFEFFIFISLSLFFSSISSSFVISHYLFFPTSSSDPPFFSHFFQFWRYNTMP